MITSVVRHGDRRGLGLRRRSAGAGTGGCAANATRIWSNVRRCAKWPAIAACRSWAPRCALSMRSPIAGLTIRYSRLFLTTSNFAPIKI